MQRREGEAITAYRIMSQKQPIGILIADDHPVVRARLAAMLEIDPKANITSPEARDCQSAVGDRTRLQVIETRYSDSRLQAIHRKFPLLTYRVIPMISLPQVAVTAKIYESANSLVYRGIREDDNTPVILKVLKQDYPTPAELTRYKQEYEITRSLNIDGVVQAYSQQDYQRTLVIILEDFGGESLAKLVTELEGQFPMSLPKFLSLAIEITEILGRIHSNDVIHKDINPSNIVLNPATGIVKLIDFGIATRLSRTNPTFRNPNVLEGTLAYMSPEQTGRMNRTLDYRTDFYSLGVTFYELLTGKLPFTTTDAMKLVHSHIAKEPLPPSTINLAIPQTVSSIVMKLMAKNAEQRYQSAWGIKADLEECLQQLETSRQIAAFPLGTQDISDKFQIPQKLYGREPEVERLLRSRAKISYQLVGQYSKQLVGQ